MRKPLTKQQAIIKAETLCAKTEYSAFEIMTKLKNWGISAGDSEEIAESLIKRKFIDEKRFAEAYTRDKYRFNHWGRRKIYANLLGKRVPKEIICESFSVIDEKEYFEKLFSFIKSRAKTVKCENDREKRMKLFKTAMSSGYETELIVKALNKLRDADEQDCQELD